MEPGQSRIRKSAFIFFFFLAAAILYVFFMRAMIRPLTSQDIIDLEIARTVDRAQMLMGYFRDSIPSKLVKLDLSVYLDFPFIVIYTGLIISGSRFFGHLSGNDLIERASRFFLFIALAAGLADIIENLLLLQTIRGEMSELVVRMTYNMAVAKFSMIIISLLFLFVEGIFVFSGLFGKRVLKLTGEEF
jgi:hypothetical protein